MSETEDVNPLEIIMRSLNWDLHGNSDVMLVMQQEMQQGSSSGDREQQHQI